MDDLEKSLRPHPAYNNLNQQVPPGPSKTGPGPTGQPQNQAMDPQWQQYAQYYNYM
jgi:hypothetical protein